MAGGSDENPHARLDDSLANPSDPNEIQLEDTSKRSSNTGTYRGASQVHTTTGGQFDVESQKEKNPMLNYDLYPKLLEFPPEDPVQVEVRILI